MTTHNGSFTAVSDYPNALLGDSVLVVVDATAGRLWARVSGAPGWARGGNPEAGTDPTLTFTPRTDVFPMVSCGASSTGTTRVSVNFGQDEFSMPVPAGFNEGWFT